MSINPVTAHIPLTTPRDYTRAIIREVAAAHGVTLAEILSDYRDHRIMRARHAAIIAVAMARPHMSTPMLGEVFRRDHSSILHALGRLGRRRKG